jgi:hypothetical protein
MTFGVPQPSTAQAQPVAGTAAAGQGVDDAALQSIKVTSGRNVAMFGFNQPAVRLWLPRVANSAYATETFDAPKLVDGKGRPVAHEVEQGLYSHDKWENEIRFVTKGDPARMIGTIHVRYPARIRAAKTSDPEDRLTKPADFVKLPAVAVELWKDIDITYDLPVIAKLPESRQGLTEAVPDTIVDTPGGKVAVTLRK